MLRLANQAPCLSFGDSLYTDRSSRLSLAFNFNGLPQCTFSSSCSGLSKGGETVELVTEAVLVASTAGWRQVRAGISLFDGCEIGTEFTMISAEEKALVNRSASEVSSSGISLKLRGWSASRAA